jgi:hypothetical protein
MSTRVAGGILAATLAIALWLAAGWSALLYTVPFAAAVAPGIPLGIALFGRRHPAAWIGGALIGYGLTQLAFWAVIVAGATSPLAFVAVWVFVLAAGFGVSRLMASAPAIPSRPWTGSDIRALLLVLLLVPALMGITYRNVGHRDASGNQYYRAYFTADFLWHTALGSELARFSQPPRNPYLAPRVMNYYWTYFLLPSVTARFAPPQAPSTDPLQSYLKTNAILAGLLMMGALFVLVRSGTSSSAAAAIAVCLAVLAASAEGLYATIDLLRRGRPLIALTDLNIDAVTAWAPFNGLRIDNIPRSLWWTPQHTTSIALGLVGLTFAALAGATASAAAIAGAGLALGLSTTMNPLLGAVCSLLYGICVIVDGVRKPGGLVAIAWHALAAVFVVAAVAWGMASRVMDGAGSVLSVGLSGMSRNSPIVTLLLALGPILLPALPGVLLARRSLLSVDGSTSSAPSAEFRRPADDETHDVERRVVTIGVAGILVGLFLLYFVRISEASWVGFRAGQLLLVSIPILLARTLQSLARPARAVLALLILFVGLPTTVIDTYNAQDIGNRRPGPGFRWTLWTTPSQQEAFAWIRTNTRDEDIVQMEPVVRGREHWTLIPSFAGRRMAAGDPISLLPVPEYKERSAQVRTLFATTNLTEAAAIAHRLRLDYLYVDDEDVRAYPEGTKKFDANPQAFERVFASGDVRVYKVR